MNHTTETIATLDTSIAAFHRRRERWACGVGRSEAQRSVRSADIVMIHEDREDPLEILLIRYCQVEATAGRVAR